MADLLVEKKDAVARVVMNRPERRNGMNMAMLAVGEAVAGLEIAGRWVDVRDPDVLRSLQDGAE